MQIKRAVCYRWWQFMTGLTREEAAKAGGMDRQTLRDWVHRFNKAGPDGLINRTSTGRKRRLSTGQIYELEQIVEAGPDTKRYWL